MPEAARLADEITHTGALGGLIAGALVGAALLVTAVAVVGLSVLTLGFGGVLACVVGAAVIGGAVAGAASVGEQLGGLCEAVSGAIAPACSPNVFVNSRNSARTEDDFATCSGAPPVGPPHPPPAAILAQGSGSVFINRMPAVRKGDLTACSAKVSTGSANVFIGGPTVQTRAIDAEVPEWLENTIKWVGFASLLILLPLAPGVIIGGLVGSVIGSWGMSKLGGALFGEGSKGQRAMGIVGGVIGGMAGGAAGGRLQGAAASRLCGTSADRVGKFYGGEPVDILTGEVFTDEIDFELPWRVPLAWRRFYSSQRQTTGALGYGWESTADTRLEILADGSVDFWDGKIAPLNFYLLPDEEGDTTEPYEGCTLAVTRTAYTVRTRAGLLYQFPRQTADERVTYIASISDANGNRVEFVRRDGGLAEIRSSCGPWLELKSEHSLLRKVILHHPRSSPRVLASYEYSSEGELVANLDPLDNPHTYVYENRRMVRHSDRNGVTFYYEYESESPDARCVHTWGENGLYDYRFTYQPELQRTLYTDSLGGEWITEYDVFGFVTRLAGPRGAATRYGYDEAGRLVTFTDPLGRVTVYEYDDHANLVAVTRPDTAKLTYRYDEQNHLVERADAAGHVWRHEWDELGRQIRQISPLGSTHEYDYDARGDVVTYRNPNGAVTRFERDPYSTGVLTATDALGNGITWALDPLGRVTRYADQSGETTDYDLDAKGRVTRVVRPSGVEVRCTYDRELNLTEYRDGMGRSTRFTYTGINELGAKHLPDGTTVRYEYDTEERLVAIVNGRGERYRYERDPRGRVIRRVDFWGAATEISRNAAGEVVERVDPLGRRTTYEHDVLGRLRIRTYGDGKKERFFYNQTGNLVKFTNTDARVEREFDADGRLCRETQNDFEVGYDYDAVGNCVGRTGSTGNVVGYAYDALNRLRSLAVNGETVLDLERDQRGMPVRERLGRQLIRSQEFDVEGRTLSQRVVGPDNAGIVRRDYQYDPAGRLRRRREGTGAPEMFDYDPVGRLILHQDPEGAIHRFLRDAAGDFLEPDPWENDDPVIPGTAPAPVAEDEPRAVASRDRQFGEKRYRFDAAGNIIEIRSIHDRTRLYWNGENRLTKARTPAGPVAHYRYDAWGRRVAKEFQKTTTSFGWTGTALMAEKSGDTWTEFVYAGQTHLPLLMIVDGSVFYYQNDVNGAPCEVFDGEGKMAWRARYGTWGTADEIGVASLDNPLRLQGQYHDAETGLHYNYHRYFDGDTGHFLTPDPIGLAGGENLYQIAPDTWNWSDPLGLSCEPVPANEEQERLALPAPAQQLALPAPRGSNPYPDGVPLNAGPAPQGMVVNMAMSPGQPATSPGGFATQDDIPNVDYVRNDLAVTPEFKPNVGSVQSYEVAPGTPIQWGPVGPQTYNGVTYPGGGSQVQILVPSAARSSVLTPVGPPRPIY